MQSPTNDGFNDANNTVTATRVVCDANAGETIEENDSSAIDPTCTLFLKDIALNIHLGVTAEEREKPQPINIDLSIRYKNTMPIGCHTDDLHDTVDYAAIVQEINAFCAKREFCLIEYLCFELHLLIKSLIPATTKLNLSIKKKPAHLNLGGSGFTISDSGEE